MSEEFFYKRTITAKKTKFTYLFSFKNIKHPDLYGNSVKDFWNDICDYIMWEGKMTVERVDGKEFTLSEVKRLHEDLIEDMYDTSCVVVATFVNLRKIEFINQGVVYDFVVNEDGTEGYKVPNNLSEKELEKEWEDLEGFRRDLSHDMSWLDDEFGDLKLQKILINFSISDTEVFRRKKNQDLKYCLERFDRFKENKRSNFSFLYNIIERIQDSDIYDNILLQSNLTENDVKKATGIMNDRSIKGSRHEGKSKSTREIKRKELEICDQTIRKLIATWLKIEGISN